MTAELLNNGFTEILNGKKFNPKNNWFGISTYEPDAIFVRGDKKAIFSLQGFYMNSDNILNAPKELLEQCACRYIALHVGEEMIYETYTGVLPSNELIEQFMA